MALITCEQGSLGPEPTEEQKKRWEREPGEEKEETRYEIEKNWMQMDASEELNRRENMDFLIEQMFILKSLMESNILSVH